MRTCLRLLLRTLRACSAVSVFALACTSIAIAAPEATTPRGVVETIIDRASKLDNKATFGENSKTIESLVDFRQLAADALGDRAKEATAAQRQEIEQLLLKIITKTVYPEAPKFFRDVKIEFSAEEKAGPSRVHVTSVVNKGDRRSTVEYWLAPAGASFRVVDLAIEGERWVENVHDQFSEIIGKSGVSGLIAKMKKRLAQLEAPKAGKKKG